MNFGNTFLFKVFGLGRFDSKIHLFSLKDKKRLDDLLIDSIQNYLDHLQTGLKKPQTG